MSKKQGQIWKKSSSHWLTMQKSVLKYTLCKTGNAETNQESGASSEQGNGASPAAAILSATSKPTATSSTPHQRYRMN